MTGTVTIYTDGACKGNTGPGGCGRCWSLATEKEPSAARRNDQQLDGDDSRHPCTESSPSLRSRSATDSQYVKTGSRPDPWLAEERLEDERQSRSRTRTCGTSSMPPSRGTTSAGTGSRAMPTTRQRTRRCACQPRCAGRMRAWSGFISDLQARYSRYPGGFFARQSDRAGWHCETRILPSTPSARSKQHYF